MSETVTVTLTKLELESLWFVAGLGADDVDAGDMAMSAEEAKAYHRAMDKLNNARKPTP